MLWDGKILLGAASSSETLPERCVMESHSAPAAAELRLMKSWGRFQRRRGVMEVFHPAAALSSPDYTERDEAAPTQTQPAPCITLHLCC